MIDLSIIIVNWNSKDYLRKCLETLDADEFPMSHEIVVIDSASFDGCGEMLAAEFPGVRFIQSDDNLGFAKSNNRAFEASVGRHILFLNPDTEVGRGAIAALYAQATKSSDVGVVGARLLNSDGSIQVSSTQAFPNLINQALDADALRRLLPESDLWGTAALMRDTDEVAEVEVISGACLMISRELFEAIGGFSEDYFMYSEDVELSFRAFEKGRRNLLVPAAVVVHHGGGSSDQKEVSTFSSVMLLESRWKYFRKIEGAGYAFAFRAVTFLAALLRLSGLWAVRLLPLPGRMGRDHSGSRKKWGARLRWCLGLEEWAENYSK